MLKNTLLISALLVAGISFQSCGTKQNDPKSNSATTSNNTGSNLKIAYVNIDTLQEHLEFFKKEKANFEKKQEAARNELASLERQLQNEVAAFQKAVQAGTLTQTEGEAKQKRLGQLQQNLQDKQASLESKMGKEMEAFNADLKKRLDDYLAKYNTDKKYDFILSDGLGSQILLANPTYNITLDVIRGMNEADKNKDATSSTTTDTSAKK